MKNYRIFAVLLPLFLLAGCGTLGNVGTVLTINTPQILTPQLLYQIHVSYETFQAAAVSLRARFPQCKATETPSVVHICYKRDTYLKIQTLDRQAAIAVNNIDAWAKAHPTIDARALIDGFNKAVATGSALITAAQAGAG